MGTEAQPLEESGQRSLEGDAAALKGRKDLSGSCRGHSFVLEVKVERISWRYFLGEKEEREKNQRVRVFQREQRERESYGEKVRKTERDFWGRKLRKMRGEEQGSCGILFLEEGPLERGRQLH